jgi:hypothetical protein
MNVGPMAPRAVPLRRVGNKYGCGATSELC